MDLFSLAARLTLDSDKFDKGVSDAERSGKGLASSLEGTFSKIKKFAAGALSVAAIKKGIDAVINLANETSAAGDKIDKQSQVLGLSRKAYQEWDYILSQNGASIDSLGVSMKTLNSLVLDAAAGGEESKETFEQLGLGIHEIEQLEPEKQFESVVRAFQKMPAGAQKSALAVKIFGRNGMELLPLLNQSATSIDELRAKAEEMGIIMSDDAVDASVAYNDAMDDLNRTFNGLKYSIGSKLLPALTTGMQKVTGFVGKISNAFQENGLQGVWDVLVEEFKNIKWPTKEEILKSLQEVWNGVKEGAKSILKLAFGETEDGGIAWPSAEDVWNKISGTIDSWWTTLKSNIEGVLKVVLGVPELPDANTAGQMLREKVIEWWNTIKTTIKGVFSWFIPNPDIQDEQGSGTFKLIKNWWNDKVVPAIKDVVNFTLGLFGLPSVDEMAKKIKNWWNTVKATVGQIVLNATVNPVVSLFGGNPVEVEGSSVDARGNDSKGYGSGSHGFAKGLNYVPFDGFHAVLHRGEQVLTASEARRNRGNSGSSTGIDTASIASAVSDAIRSAMSGVSVNSYLSGKDITDSVDRDMARKLKARRFAT